MNSGKFYVYGHYTLDTSELFYIGKGTGLRLNDKRKRNKFWTNVSKKHGFKALILLGNLQEDEAFLQEYYAIKEFRPRTNLSVGGQGFTSELAKKRWQDPEYRQKMSLLLLKQWNNPERVAAASKTMQTRWQDKDRAKPIRAKIAETLTGRKLSPEHAIKARAALVEGRKLIDQDKRREACTRANTSRVYPKLSEEQKAKIGFSLKGKKFSPEANLKRAICKGAKPFLVFDKATLKLVGEWINVAECARDLNLNGTNIGRCLHGKENRVSHKGKIFKFKENL